MAESLEQLWISYNLIEKMAGIEALTNIRTLYMSNNLVSKWTEIQVCLAQILPALSRIVQCVVVATASKIPKKCFMFQKQAVLQVQI